MIFKAINYTQYKCSSLVEAHFFVCNGASFIPKPLFTDDQYSLFKQARTKMYNFAHRRNVERAC